MGRRKPSQRLTAHLLLIDTRRRTRHDELQRILAPYGVTVDVVNDGSDGLGRAASIGPELLIIAVDLPDKVGYGICNKAKKGVAKHIPVMLATASITPADLEQHRRLKVHADEYVDKRTITEDDLLAKIDALVNLGPPMEDVPIEDLGVEHEEIAFEDSDDFVSEATSVSAGVDGLNLGIDPGIDAETDAVFAGLVEGPGVGDEERTVPPKSRTPDAPQFLSTPPPTSPPVSATLGAARLGVRTMNANGATSGAIAAVTPPAPLPPAPAPSFVRAPSPATVPPASSSPSSSSSASSPGNGDGTLDVVDEPAGESDHEIHERHQAQVADLEAQVTKLRVQLDEVRRASPTPATPAPSSFSREREFLNLREVINRKEKDLLDLKDELDGRDRLILGGKEKIREQERKLRDADEKLLHFEQELVNAREALAALRDDKEKALEREKGLKARIEMAQTQAKKTDDEIEALRKKGLADLQALRDENNARRQDADREKKELATQVAGLQAQVAAAIRQGENERQSLQKSITQQLTGEREAAVAAVRAELGELLDRKGKEHMAELTAVRDENRGVVTKMQGEHAAALARADTDHHAALVKANEEKAAAVTMAEERRKRELIDNDEMWRAEAKAAERRREKELGARDEEHKRALGDVNSLHAAKLEKLDKDHKDGLQAARDQAARDQAAVAERHRQELATADQRRQREASPRPPRSTAARSPPRSASTASRSPPPRSPMISRSPGLARSTTRPRSSSSRGIRPRSRPWTARPPA